MKAIYTLLCIVILAGCAMNSVRTDIIVDGTTAESTERDVKLIVQSLSRKKRLDFTRDMIKIQLFDVKSAWEAVQNPAMLSGPNYELLKDKLDGLNYAQIKELAKRSSVKVEAQ